MTWRNLLEPASDKGGARVVAPWTGGRKLLAWDRAWTISHRLPDEIGWHLFRVRGRDARWMGATTIRPTDDLRDVVCGYLVGDRLVEDGVRVDPDPAKISAHAEPVFFVEAGVDRFARASAGRFAPDGPLIFRQQEMPAGPEDDVLRAFLDRAPSVGAIHGVSPALDAAFRMETFQRAEADRRRIELERKLREEEEKKRIEERRKQIEETLGTGEGRRQMALVDFGAAAKAALAVGGATYLDHRRSVQRGEMVVRFRLLNRRFECTCEERTLAIVDAGVCLTAHEDDDEFEEGTKGDRLFTLESLPSVLRQADKERKLVVFRHVE